MGDNIPKKNLLIAVAILAVASLIFIIVSLLGGGTNDKKEDNINPYTNEEYLSQKEVQKKVSNMDVYSNLDIVVKNLYDFVKVYKGDLETKDYTDYIKNLNSDFANLYTKVSNSNADKYFNDNKDEITEKYGITNISDFKKLVEYVSIYKTEGLYYKEVTLVKNSPVVETDYTITKLNLTYSNDVAKTLNIAVTNDSNSNNPKFVISFE